MNLKQNPTREQLARLIAGQNDEAGHHMLWVSVDGEVFLDLIPNDLTPIGYEMSLADRMQFRLSTLMAGRGHVGSDAAAEAKWVDRVYTVLLANFQKGAKGCVDVFWVQ